MVLKDFILYVFFFFVYCRYLYTFDTIGVLEPDQTLEISFKFIYKYGIMALGSSLSCFLHLLSDGQRNKSLSCIHGYQPPSCSKTNRTFPSYIALNICEGPEKGRSFALL